MYCLSSINKNNKQKSELTMQKQIKNTQKKKEK